MPHMSFDLLQAFNIAMSVLGVFGGWFVKSLFDRLRSLEAKQEKVNDSIAGLRNEMPNLYVRRDDYKDALDAIFGLLRRIEDKVDKKADRP